MPYKSRSKRVAYLKAWRQRKAESGLCGRCGSGRPQPPRSTCSDCLDYIKNRKVQNKESGRCVDCGCEHPEINFNCPLCQRRHEERAKLRRSLD